MNIMKQILRFIIFVLCSCSVVIKIKRMLVMFQSIISFDLSTTNIKIKIRILEIQLTIKKIITNHLSFVHLELIYLFLIAW